ncbi:SUF system NifU family Fe-S cluster assembly protein [Planococcaceae bacterium Storch 2/2-2]|nr:SUF system NifU family Fe-S cluster assembly protein [Planococcaceae bacterium Storch 2/2-2]
MSMNKLDQLYRTVIMEHSKRPKNKGVLDANNVTVDMNNPTCGDVIHLTMRVEDDIVQEAKFEGEGCSISMASASMMTDLVKGKTIDEALRYAEAFSNMMLGEEVDDSIDFEDVEALAGVAKFPARIKCATLAWKAMEKGLGENN